MNILYLSYDGLTDPLGQSQILPYINGLSQHGYNFTIISFEKKERYHHNKDLILKICKANYIDWHPIFYTKNPPIISTIWDVFKLKIEVNKLYKKKQFKLVHCRSYIPSLLGLCLKQKYNVNFIFDMRGFWADERVDGNLWNLNNPIYKIIYNYFKDKEKQFIEHSDKIISLTQNGKDEILRWNIKNLYAEKIEVIPCSADYNLFEIITEEKKTKAKDKLGIPNDFFVLSYIGSIGTWYLLDEMLHFFNLLKQHNRKVKFLFLTPDNKKIILNKGENYNLAEEDFVIKFAQRKSIPSYIHASDFSIFFITPTYSKKSSSPTKMGELMAMGIPIICNKNVGDVESIINSSKAGLCLEHFNEDSFLSAITKIDNHTFSSPEKIRESSKQFYDLENGINLYLSIYKRLLLKNEL